ncbi:hypothetical protein [Crocosphaera sp. Alani8]|uniref:hypothetical protein n=1 Tax=Crocosphaera sp. Alani8 TaxID=3038952 RepID=UPI00313E7FEB
MESELDKEMLKEVGVKMIQKTINQLVITTLLILWGIFGQSLCSLAKEPMWSQLPNGQDSSPATEGENQLEGIHNQQWQWQVEPEDRTDKESIEEEYPLDVNSNNSVPSVNPMTEEQEWEDSNTGDPVPTGGTVPLVEF